MFRSIAQESFNNNFNRNFEEKQNLKCCWAELGTSGFIATTEEELRNLIFSSSKINVSGIRRSSVFDHVYGGLAVYMNMSKTGTGQLESQNMTSLGSPTMILYAALGTSCFNSFHNIMAAASLRGQIQYVHRPILLAGCEASGCVGLGATDVELRLGGFGVEMAIKNTEYNHADISRIRSENDGDMSNLRYVLSRHVELGGCNLTALVVRFPGLASKLTTIPNRSQHENIRENLDIWHIKNIGLQATHRILSAADPFKMLEDISQKFPSLAAPLSRVEAGNSLMTEIIENQKVILPGARVMYMNRRPLKLDTIDLFSLVEHIWTDIREGHSLRDFGLDSEQIRTLLQPQLPMQIAFGEGQPRINLEDSDRLVSWTNNIELDKNFEDWSRSIELLISAQQDGSIPRLRRNIFNIVAVIDLSQREGLNLVSTVQRYINKFDAPLRLGLVLVDREAESESEWKRDANGNGVFQIKKQNGDFELPFGISIGAALARAGTLLSCRYGGKYAGEFTRGIGETHKLISQGNVSNDPFYNNATWAAAKETFNQIFKRAFVAREYFTKGVRPDEDTIDMQLQFALADILSFDLEERDDLTPSSALYVSQAKDLIAAKGITVPSVLVNGLYCSLANARKLESELEQVAMHLVQLEIQTFATAISEGSLTDKILDTYPGGAYGWVLRDATPRYIPFIQDEVKFPSTYLVMRPSSNRVESQTYPIENFVNYICEDSLKVKDTTVWFVSDASRPAAKAVIDAAIDFNQRTWKGAHCQANVRFAVLHPPGVTPSQEAREAAQKFRSDHLGDYDLESLLVQQGNFVARLLGQEHMANFRPPEVGLLIVNGRILDIPRDHHMDAEDFCLLLSQEHRAHIDLVRQIVGRSVPRSLTAADTTQISDMYMLSTSLLAWRRSKYGTRREEAEILKVLEFTKSAVSISGHGTVAFEAVLDPLSKDAQRVISLINVIKETLTSSVTVRIVLNPINTLHYLPLSSYYRYAVPLAPISIHPRAYFTGLPLKEKYTAHLDIPEAWLVTTTATQYDLDHLSLEEVPDGFNLVEAEFQVEALLVTGHCVDINSNEHPRGLQLTLKNPSERAGTIVMSTLGYFQLPSAPGVWSLELRPDQSASNYYMVPSDEFGKYAQKYVYQQPTQDRGVEFLPNHAELYVASWKGVSLNLYVKRRPKMESRDVLTGIDHPASLETERKSTIMNVQLYVPSVKLNGRFSFSSILASFLGRWKLHTFADTKPSDSLKKLINSDMSRSRIAENTSRDLTLAEACHGEKIHIFSVASGYLYERLIKVMMLSVRRNTKNPIKFWFVKNWLSPRFKQYLPHFASRYRFEYELVTYKWPTWLQKQTEKQRIIWAYKLLFLDVIFPLSLEKIIFVDADQVVRADIKELWEIDLHGAPYAYTPFCDDNKLMDGFRFWKQGFWQRHLDGKPYHISALYVVDLKRFRQLAAGDTLRVIYENLSKDLNSLANLDQDLPNYAQHQVPIFSLPQQWLWCESWCGNQTKLSAKTIDLCNNPMTKEPKLKGAVRIIAEWSSLDNELQQHTLEVEQLMANSSGSKSNWV